MSSTSKPSEKAARLIEQLKARGLKRVGGTRWPQWYADLPTDVLIFVFRDGSASSGGNHQSKTVLDSALAEVR